MPLKIIIADDHEIIRIGVKFLLKEHYPDVEIYEAINGDQLHELTKKHFPNIVLMDLHMPNTDSQGVLRHLLLLQPKLNVLIFSMHKEEIYGKLYLKMGAVGYVQKDSPPEDLITAINSVLAGNIYMRKDMQQFYIDDTVSIYEVLTKKEMEILYYINRGDSGIKIARTLNLSSSTIGTHKANIFLKLNVDNFSELKEITTIYPLLE